MKRSEKRSDEKRPRVLRPGESFLLNHTARDLEIVLYRPLQRGDSVQPPPTTEESPLPTSPVSASDVASSEEGGHPLFFDTTACFFLDGAGKVDYVTPGHTGISTQGAVYLPHTIVTGGQAVAHHVGLLSAPIAVLEDGSENVWAVTSPLAAPLSYTTKQNGVMMAPGDGVLLNFSALNTCMGALICATLFTPGVLLSRVVNTFFVVRRAKTATPLCFIPISAARSACKSCVPLMLRRVRVKGEVSWEIVNVAEEVEHTDVKGVLRALQFRGLRDPAGYTGGAMLATDDASDCSDECDDATEELSSIQNDQGLEESPSHSTAESETAHSPPKPPLEQPVAHSPRLVRRGKHQYNVGRSAARPGSSSEEDEAMDDVLRAVVPRYAASEVVRYESGTYNVGSKPTTLASHYVDYREHYAVEAADVGTRDFVTSRKSAPSSKSNSLGPATHTLPAAVLENRRDSDSAAVDPASCRPELPFELLSPAARAAVVGAQQSRDNTNVTPRQRTSRSRSHSKAKKKKKKAPSASKRPNSRSTSPAEGSDRKRTTTRAARPGSSSKRTASSTTKKTHESNSRNSSRKQRPVAA